MTFDEEARECLGEDVGCHVGCRDIEWFDLPATYSLTNPEVTDPDLLHATVMFRVVGGSDSGLVVHSKNERGSDADVETKFSHELTHPNHLCSRLGSGNELGLST